MFISGALSAEIWVWLYIIIQQVAHSSFVLLALYSRSVAPQLGGLGLPKGPQDKYDGKYWKVTKYIYSSSSLTHSFEVLYISLPRHCLACGFFHPPVKSTGESEGSFRTLVVVISYTEDQGFTDEAHNHFINED